MPAAPEIPAEIAFGRFRLSRSRRELLLDGQPVRLGSRALDVLMALVEAQGAVLSKEELMTRVWSGQVVEENNLEVQISMLRRAFADHRDLIRTVSGRGYAFAGGARPAAESSESRWEPRSKGGPPPTNLPLPTSDLVGRDDALRDVLSLAATHRLLTLTGAGGIGKTRLALAAARALPLELPDGRWLVELSPLADPALVPATVAATLDIALGGGEITVPRLAQALAGRRLLLVLDTCEHVIGAVAALAEAVLRAGSEARIIATSREPLGVEGEWTYLIPPLAVPAEESAEDIAQYGATRLFIERARAADPHFAADGSRAGTIAAICRQLDGIPLAIELAAALTPALGVEELAVRLDDRFRLLRGRRTALPRHHTLRATLDWSYGLLTEPERVLLRRFAIFAGAFTPEAASAVAACPLITPLEVLDCLSSVVAKSLVVTEVDGTITRHRLLDTTRAYALEKLDESGERAALARRHAEYCRDLFERAEAEWETRPTVDWLADYGRHIGDLRAALDWALAPGGDAALGVALATAALPLWMYLPLLQECRGHAERALAALAAAASPDARHEMKLHAALGVSLAYTGGTVPQIRAAWERALRLAERLGDADYRLRALFGLWVHETQEALGWAEQFAVLAENPADRVVAARMIGTSHYFRGDHASARRHLERVIADDPTHHSGSRIRFQFDQQLAARAFRAPILWLQGFPEQAIAAAAETVEQARAIGHANSLCQALARAACPIALWVGDLDEAEHYIGQLRDQSTRHALTAWRAYDHTYQGVLLVDRGNLGDGIPLLRQAFHALDTAFSGYRLCMFLGALAAALGRAGQSAEGLATIDGAIERAERTEESWVIPELLRIKGELTLLQGGGEAAAEAMEHFRAAIDWARRQGALSWELRAATSAARLLRDGGDPAAAATLLGAVYGRFTEGFDTADLRAAERVLGALR